jgi:hypothetical protein
MNAESRRTDWHDDFPSSQTIPQNALLLEQIASPRITWALAYADRGWPVLPLHPSTKRPATPRGLLDATTDQRQIREWWRRSPLANIGLVTGVAFDVLDCDVQVLMDGSFKHTSGPHLDRLNDRGLLSGCAGASRTRHGGLHLFFSPSGQRTRHFSSQHLDLLGSGSYIVAPPSNVPPDTDVRGSGQYTWLTFPDMGGTSVGAVDFDAIRGALMPRQAAASPSKRGQCSVTSLADHVRNTPEGSRNARTYWALCRALESGQPINTIIEAAMQAGLDKLEVASVVRSARRTVGV